jgi:hypothetical protein
LLDIKGLDRKKPLGYDPKRDRFIYYDEIITGKEKIMPLEGLTRDQLKKLIVERNRVGPHYEVGDLSGRKYTRDDVINAIIEESSFGKMALEAEVSYLTDLLKQIEEALGK